MNDLYYPKGTNATPFNPQLQHFDMICGQIMQENRILRYVAVISCLAFFLSVGINFYAASLPETVPVLVTMNDFGQTQYIGEVTRKNWQNFSVPEIAVANVVKEFISLSHEVSTDKNVMRKNVKKAYHFLTTTSANKFSTLLREDNPYQDFGRFTKEVTFETEPLKISKDTYQVDYKVTERLLAGQIKETKTLRAVASVMTMQPSKDDIGANPLGIYITNFDIKELTK